MSDCGFEVELLENISLYPEQGLCREYTSYFGKRASLSTVHLLCAHRYQQETTFCSYISHLKKMEAQSS